jgi:uncharacterized protein
VFSVLGGKLLGPPRPSSSEKEAQDLFRKYWEDPEMRPKPISPEKREEVIVHMAAGLLASYRYFRSHRQVSPSAHTGEPRRNVPKVGRNDPCPCGSGKKYKRCCGGATVN